MEKVQGFRHNQYSFDQAMDELELTEMKPLTGQKILIITPGKINYFYDVEGLRVAEALRNLGGTVEIATISDYREATYDWCFLVNLLEIVHAQDQNVAYVLQQIERLKSCCAHVITILLECTGTRWFNESLDLLKKSDLNILLDLGFHDQYQQSSKNAQAVYHFAFNGLTTAERRAVLAIQPSDRPIPWTFVGHLTPVRLKFLQQLVEDVDKKGFVYAIQVMPITEDGPHLNQQQLLKVLKQTRYKIWCSFHEHLYLESVRFRLAALAGALPIKVNMVSVSVSIENVPFTSLLLDAENFPKKLKDFDFDNMRNRFVDEFCSLPSLETSMFTTLQKIG